MWFSIAAKRAQDAPQGGRRCSAREAEAAPAELGEGRQRADPGERSAEGLSVVAGHLGGNVEHGGVRPSVQPGGVGAELVRPDRSGRGGVHE